MAEDDAKTGKAATALLKRSRGWGRVLKERAGADGRGGEHSAAGGAHAAAAFELDQHVVDFLKPSTEKSKPKIDIAIAKRWPGAHDVRRAGDGSALPPAPAPTPAPAAFTKPSRRPGLRVSFAKTRPDIIGEGGDGARDPATAVSTTRAALARSASDGQPHAVSHGPRAPPLAEAASRGAASISPPREGLVLRPVRSMGALGQASSPPMQRNSPSPPMQRNIPSPSKEERGPATRQDSPNEARAGDPQPPAELHPPRQRPAQIDTRVRDQNPRPGSAAGPGGLAAVRNYLLPSPDSATRSPVAERRREMSTSEGMALRKASMMIATEHDDSADTDEQPPLTCPALQPSSAQSAPSPVGTPAPEAFPPDPATPPETAITPQAPTPFADPNYTTHYTRHHTREASPGASRPSTEQAQSLRQHRPTRDYNRSPQPTGAPPRAEKHMVPQISPPQQQPGHPRVSPQAEDCMRATQPPAEEGFAPSRPASRPSSRDMHVPDVARDASRSPRPPDRPRSPPSPDQSQLYARPNGLSSSINHPPQARPRSRPGSRDEALPHLLQPATSGHPQPLSPRYQKTQLHAGFQDRSPHPSCPGGSTPSPAPSTASRNRPEDYFSAPAPPQEQAARSPMAMLRQEESARPASAGSNLSRPRSSYSLQSASESNTAADAALADFAARVKHMKGVFGLTAEKELPGSRCTPTMWLRAGLWWYLVGKSGLESLLQQQRNSHDRRQLLTQAHVDLAKAWWILTDPLAAYDTHHGSPLSARSDDSPDVRVLAGGTSALKAYLGNLALSMGKNRLLPPEQSLIQGQNTRIWIDYPRFTSDAIAVLGGSISKSVLVQDSRKAIDPYDMLPLGDGRGYFCYGRFPVDVFLNTDDADTDRVVLPCMLTVVRGRQDFQTSISIASQSELVNVKISPRQGERRTLTWADVTWKASAYGMLIHLPRNFDLGVRMQERDFRAVWNLSEYARKVEKCLRPEEHETMIHQARLAELQYVDSSDPNAFAPDKVRGCTALVFERHLKHVDGSGMHQVHRGYRLLLVTDPGHKTLSAISHEIGTRTPFYFEFLTDPTAQGTTAMVIRIREEKRQCRALLVFPDANSRQALYDVLNGLDVRPEETIVGRMRLTSLNIQPASQSAGFSSSAHPALQHVQWQKLGVTNARPDDANGRTASTVQSDKLRIVARHSTGCITDRLHVGKGELLLRVPASGPAIIQLLRERQEDMTVSIDTRNSPQHVSDGMGQLLHTVRQQPTIRTFTFASRDDLHAFQAAITGYTVRYDGIASSFGISRRRMVVPIYKKLEAGNVRLQIVSKDSVVQLLAFMEEFSHADAMCFQIKSTDDFEQSKGDSKGKKWSVKLVDAKFSLPPREKDDPEEVRVKQRFVNLEGLDYAEEHDDITVGFDSEQDRDRFTQALPATASAHRGITLKRRI